MKIKFCKNCQHFRSDSERCMRPEGLSLVYGTVKIRNSPAASERTYDTTGCGTAGKFFELKQEQ